MPVKVIVSKSDPTMSYPLVAPEDYAAVGLPYPEGMDILYRKYIECEGE